MPKAKNRKYWLSYKRKWHHAHKQEANERSRKWRENHKEQNNQKSRDYYWEHKAEITIQRRKYYKKNRKEIILKSVARQKANYERTKHLALVRAYGISLEHYNTLRHSQNYSCAICGGKEGQLNVWGAVIRKLFVDHCHRSKKVRGLLCSRCNQVIGRMEDNPSLLIKAAKYLEAMEKRGMDLMPITI